MGTETGPRGAASVVGGGSYAENVARSLNERSPLIPKGEAAGSGVGLDGGAMGEHQVQVFKRRWLMLVLFCITSMSNAAHWIMYAVIANITMRYYNVSAMAINWTSIIFMAFYVPLSFPASWIIERHGLRTAVLLGATLMTAGSWLKVVSTSPDRFDITFIGQALVGIAQMFTLGVPGRLAAVWFGSKEVSFACAVGVFGNQLGIALGFLIPPAIVGDHKDLDKISEELKILYYVFAAVPTITLALLLCFFESRPPAPPSLAQAVLLKQQTAAANGQATISSNGEDGNASSNVVGRGSSDFLHTLKALFSNRSFVLLFASYGMNVGTFYSLSTLLNQVILEKFPPDQYPTVNEDVGRVGLTMVLMGVLGSIAGGLVLDAWHKFKETTVIVYLLAILGMLAFAFTLDYSGSMLLVYITAGFLGFCTSGYVPIGYEFGAELTYPLSEGTSVGLMNAAGETIGIALVLGAGEILEVYGETATNYTFIATLCLGFILCLFVKNDLRRLAATKQEQQNRNTELTKESTRF